MLIAAIVRPTIAVSLPINKRKDAILKAKIGVYLAFFAWNTGTCSTALPG